MAGSLQQEKKCYVNDKLISFTGAELKLVAGRMLGGIGAL